MAADGSAIPSVAVESKGPLIVPLLDSNGRPGDALSAAAAAALLRGEGVGKASATSSSAVAPIPVVPLLVRGRLDGVDTAADDTSQYRSDVALRPDAPSLDAYAAMPVDAIGKAMLLGMGWVEGGGVGRKRQVFEPVDLARRPERLGLGAKTDDEKLPPTHKKRTGAPSDASTASTAPASAASSAPRTFAVGVTVAIVGGRHEGVSGRIEELVGDKQLAVRLVSDELVTIKRKYAEVREPALVEQAAATSSSSSKKRSKTSSSDAVTTAAAAATSTADGAAKRARKAEPPAEIWVRPNIMVRIVSKKFRDGKFYEKKARVLDCVGGELCVVELTDGRVLDDVTQSVLENVVGRVGNRVQVLRGERAGALGVVLERNADKQVALVQLDVDSSKPHQFSYDDIALYATSSEQE